MFALCIVIVSYQGVELVAITTGGSSFVLTFGKIGNDEDEAYVD